MALVVVGAGAAGLAACGRIASRGKEAILISRDRRPYSLCALPYIVSGEIPEEAASTLDEAGLRAAGVEPVLGRELVAVRPAERILELDDGSEVGYEKLLLATGSAPFLPPVPGLEGLMEGEGGDGPAAPGTRPLHTLNSMEDARRLSQACGSASSAVVLGAGLTGIECACALRRRGLEVTVVEMERRVLPRILDPDMSPAAERALEEGGVRLLLGRGLERVRLSGEFVKVLISGGEELEASLAVFAMGVRPEIRLAKAAGIRTARGIVVGPDMRTSESDIFAAGDCAELDGTIPATWLTAVRQGELAAENMAGGKALFEHLDAASVATLFEVPVVGIGTPAALLGGGKAAGGEGLETRVWEKGGVRRKLVMRGGKVAGYQCVGSLGVRGMPSLLAREAGELERRFARAGLYHPGISLAFSPSLRRGPGRGSSHIRRPRGTP